MHCFRCGRPWLEHQRVDKTTRAGKTGPHRVCEDGKRAVAWRKAASNSFTLNEIKQVNEIVRSVLRSGSVPVGIVRSKEFAGIAAKFRAMQERIENPIATAPCPYCKRPYRISGRARAENPFCPLCLHERMALSAPSGAPT